VTKANHLENTSRQVGQCPIISKTILALFVRSGIESNSKPECVYLTLCPKS